MPIAFDSKRFLRDLTNQPGVYKMLDQEGTLLYVGKARNLKKRVSQYFRPDNLDPKTGAMVAKIADIAVTVTETESEALLLENNLIKSHRPRYNILFRDDKSYPYAWIPDDHAFPKLVYYRGKRKKTGKLFGPFPNGYAVRESLQLLYKVFGIRQCTDNYFANRTRPCLQYQIQRCSGPCVDLISQQAYRQDLIRAEKVLQGKSNVVINELVAEMEAAADAQQYERAARFRDQITSLRKVQTHQKISGAGGDIDFICATTEAGQHVIAIGHVREGQYFGHKTYFPKAPGQTTAGEMITAFITQYYADQPAPKEIVCGSKIVDQALLENALQQRNERQVKIKHAVRGERAGWLSLTQKNAVQELAVRLASDASIQKRLASLQTLLELDHVPSRIECFDISHTMGEATVASCVVFNESGPLKSAYRRFNIRVTETGDDYAAMREALSRRYKKIIKESAPLPDIVIIDGGKGQLTQAQDIMLELNLPTITLLGVSKGPARKAGEEKLHTPEWETPVSLASDSPVLHLIQQIRDEAHRFAITGHRARRAKARTHSVLEDIEGLGPKRRQLLLQQFGGLAQIKRAAVNDLAQIKGISRLLAEKVYNHLHENNT